jgi:hypothetical protein
VDPAERSRNPAAARPAVSLAAPIAEAATSARLSAFSSAVDSK